MRDWIEKLTIYAVLLCSLWLGTGYAAASQLTTDAVQQLVAPVVELASFENPLGDNYREEWLHWRATLKDTDKLNGLFTIYRHPHAEKLYLELQPQQLNHNYLATVTLESGIGENGIYSGLPLQDFLFYFRRVNNQVHFVVRNVKFRATADTPEQRALSRSFSDSVLYTLDIESINPHSQSLLINLYDLLMQDFPGLTALLKYSLQTEYDLEPNRSYLSSINSFPLNLEIDSNYGFSAKEGANLASLADSRGLNLQVHYSFSQLPENNGYVPRIADDRVGYFVTAFQDFSPQPGQEPFVRYINRWHLEAAIPNVPLSPPKQPIVFWIENAVPQQYRAAIQEGVLMWNSAFTKAGFSNALEVRQMPDDADWQPGDVRYNTIRWFNSLDAGFARGPVRVNPLTGEILDADIIVDANMVRSLGKEYRIFTAATAMDSDILSPKHPCQTQDSHSLHQILVDNDSCYSIEAVSQAAMGALALSLLPDSTPGRDQMQEYVHQYVRALIAHEVGHTLGLRHNFHGSTMLSPAELNNTEITHSKGLVGSVMDYLPVNLAPKGVTQGDYFPAVVGPYDEWAIAYGYKRYADGVTTPTAEKAFLTQMVLESPEPELSYATDEDIWDINPLANVWDLSSDVLQYSQWQMDNARRMWQRLDQSNGQRGEGNSNLRGLFNRVFNYYGRNATLLTQYIGGQSWGHQQHPVAVETGEGKVTSSHPNLAFTPISVEKQRQTLVELQKYVLAEDAFQFSPQLLNQLAPVRAGWGNSMTLSRLDYPIHERILRLQSGVLRSLFDGDRLQRLLDIEFKSQPGDALSIPELFSTLQTGIWTEVVATEASQPISSLRRSLQREHLQILLDMVLRHSDVPEDGRTVAWYQLRQLQAAITKRLKYQDQHQDIYTLAHLEESCDRIHQALNAQLLSR